MEELDFFVKGQSSVLVRAGVSCCRKAVVDIRTLFDPNVPLLTEEAEPKYLLYADMLRIPALSMDENWQPELGDQNLLINGILKLVANNHFDWRQAFEAQSMSRNHEATERIIEYLRDNPEASIDFKELERVREERLRECRDSLKRDIKDTRNQIESTVALGILKEANRADYAAMIVDIEKSLDRTVRFYKEHNELQAIKSEINEKKLAAIENVKQRLDTLSLASENPNYVRIIQLFKQVDVLTATEYIDMVERGDTIPEPKAESNCFSDFFPDKVIEVDKFMEEVSNPLIVIQKVQNRESFCEINLRRPSAARYPKLAGTG